MDSLTQTLTVPEGGSNSYTVVLGSRPTGDVSIGVTLPAGTDLTLSSDTLTFTTGDWDVPQTVTVTAAEDDDAATDPVATLTHTVSGGGYTSTTVPDVEVSITENDTPDIVLSKTRLDVTEGDAVGSSYTVALATKPSAGVSVSITGHTGTDLSLDKTTLTFTTGNWNTAQTVTVKAGQDDDTVSDAATLRHTASGGDYASITADLPVTVTDAGDPHVTVQFGAGAYTVSEGSTTTITVTLSADPKRTVIIPFVETILGNTTSADYSVQPSVTFNSGETSQTFDFTAVQDDVDDDDESMKLAFGPIPDARVSAGPTRETTVSITDDDTAGVTIEPTALSVLASRSNEYAVRLDTQPTGEVSVTVSGHASTDLTLNSDTLTFTVGNWDDAQTVTVSAAQNATTGKITLTHAVVGADYDSVTADPVVVSVVGVAGQRPTIQVGVDSLTQTLTVPEGGSNSYTVVLGSRPTGDVSIGVTLPAGTDLTLSSATLTFTTGDWDVPQTVTVTAAEDDDAATDPVATLTHTVSGGGYTSTTVPDVEVSITENDTPDIVLSKTRLDVTEGDAVGSSYTVALATKPSAGVSVSITGHSGTDLSLDKTTLTFTTGNWNTAQTVTVKAGQDDDTVSDAATLRHTASGGDYVNVTRDLLVTVTDAGDPHVTVQFGAGAYTVSEGSTTTITVTLSADPKRTVIIPFVETILGNTTSADYSVQPSVTFNSGETSQTFDFTAVQDDVDDDDESMKLAFGPIPDARVSAGPTRETTVSITDDDTAGVTIEPTALSVLASRSNEYAVRLDTQPTGEVSVTISGHASTDVTLDKTELTFTVGNWDDAQTVTVSAAENATTGKITLTHAVSGADYGSVTADPVVVSVVGVAAQQPPVQVGVSSLTQTLTVPEGGSNSYTVVLGSRPTGDVSIGVTLPAGTDLTLSSDTLTFTTGDWDVPQTVTVTAAEDDDAATDPVATLTHTVSGGGYTSTTVPDVEVSITENDTPDIVLSKTRLTLTEGDAVGTSYTVALTTEPSGSVSVSITGHAGTDLSLSGATLSSDTLTFTVNDWDDAQTVTVKAGQDDDAVNDTATLTHTASGGDYANVTRDLPVTVTDNDSAGLVISKDNLTVGEGDAAGMSYTVALTTEPSGSVSVSITGHAGTDLSLSGATLSSDTLTFTVNDWDDAQTVTVKAGQDDDAVNDTATLTHTASGGDYVNVTRGLPVTVTDNDSAGLVISKDNLTVGEGDAAGMSYTVALTTEPSDSVSVSITGHADTDLSLSGATLSSDTLTFTVNDWDDAQTVTVKAGQDDDAVNDTATLTHTASGGDYVNVTRGLPVTVTDNDSAGLVISKDNLTVGEGDAAGMSYTVALATQPSDSVSVSITGHADTDLSLSGATLSSDTLTFTVNDWDDAQTVTVKAGQDDDAVNDTATLTHTASGGDYANVTRDLPVTVTENDSAGLVISKDNLTVGEGDAAGMSYTVALATQPSASVTVTITGHDGTDLTLSSDTLTFTVNDWDDAQTVTVKAGQDDDAVNDTATLTHTASGGDYVNVTRGLPVTVTDNDSAGLVISKDNLTVGEGDAAGMSYTVALATQPSDSVSVSITGHADTDLSLSGATLSSDTLTFTVNDWDDAQTVTVKAGQDDDGVNDTATLTHTASGGDYVNVTRGLPVTVTDNDSAGLVISKDNLTVGEGDAAGRSYTVALATQPTASVTVTITGHDGTDLTLNSDTLTFTVNDWDDAQTVTVKAGQDDDGVNDTATLTHTASGGDYVNVTRGLPVTVTDNDSAGLVISKDNLTVGEGDAAGRSYTVALTTEPSGSVSVSITGHAGTDLSLSGATLSSDTLTFTVNDWDDAQTVTVKAGQDDDAVNDTATLTHTASGGDYVNVTRGLPVTVTDNDPQVTVQFGADAYTVSEGSRTTITVTLSADPKSTVVIPLDATGQDGATSDDYHVPSSVTINGGEMSKTFEFMAMADDASDDGESVMIGFGTNLPSRVTKGTPEETMVSIRQMNPQLGSGVTVQFEVDAYTVSEGGTATITVTLSADPQSTVVIPITATNQGGATTDDYSDVPASVTFNAGKTLTSFNFMATQDDVDENCECVLLTFGALPSGVTAGPTDAAKVSIIDKTTPNGPPTVPPGPFDLTAYGGDQALYVQWETPAAEEERAPVTSYRLRYRQVGTSSWRNVSRANVGLRLREEITGLTNRSAYEVQVAAVNRIGTGAWASVKGTPQAPYALPPGPEGDEAFDLGRLGVNWLHPAANGSNVLKVESCTGAEDFRVIWTGPQGNRSADEWAVHINTRGGAGEVSYSITPRGDYFEMNGTANFEGDGALSLSVRGRFGSAWGTWWSPPVSIYCHEPEAPADTCDLQVQQQAVENTLAEGEPRINGIPESGQTLSADTSGITDDDGFEGVVFNYQWLADDAEVNGATGSTYTMTSDNMGKAITVRVDFTDDAGHEESVTSPPAVVTSADLELRSATVDGAMLTLTYNEVLDNLVSVPQTAFAVNVNGDPRSVGGVGFGESNVLLFLSSAVEAGDTVTVDYTAPDDTGFIQDILDRKADSYTGQAVTNNTDLAPLTASAHDVPSSHNGQDAFIFELRFSEDPKPDFSYTTVRDHAVTVTGGSVTYVRRLEPGKNLRWEIHVTPGSGADVAIALNATTNCSAQGAICTGDGRKLSGGPLLVVRGPNTPATPNTPAIGLPAISGTAQVGETLTADTTGISDGDGLYNATFAYQWLADDAEIDSATASTYTLVADEEGKAIKVSVSFTDDAGSDEELTSAATGAVTAAPPLPNTPAIGLPTISGTAQVGETLTADTTGISDGDGLYNATFAYQWLADDAEINGATASSYTLVADEEGKAIKVSVSFTDDAGSDEELTSAATGAVAVAVVNQPLTASAQNVPLSHDGSGTFIFELRFSDELAPDFGYVTMRDHALTVTGGSVTYVRRLEPPSNIGWEIHVTPDSDGSLTIVLPVTTDCNATGAICTGDGRKLSNRNGFTVAGPGQ